MRRIVALVSVSWHDWFGLLCFAVSCDFLWWRFVPCVVGFLSFVSFFALSWIDVDVFGVYLVAVGFCGSFIIEVLCLVYL